MLPRCYAEELEGHDCGGEGAKACRHAQAGGTLGVRVWGLDGKTEELLRDVGDVVAVCVKE